MVDQSQREHSEHEEGQDMAGLELKKKKETAKGNGSGKKGAVTAPANLKTKISLDFAEDNQSFDLVQSLLARANDKVYGRPVELKEIILLGLSKVTPQDVEALQETTLSKMDKIHLLHEKFNRENNTSLSFDEFLFNQINKQ